MAAFAHPYLTHLLKVSGAELAKVRDDILAHNRGEMPGLVRVSFGMYNTTEEVDVLVRALSQIARGDFRGKYEQDVRSGEYSPVGWNPDLNQYFKL